MVHRRFCCPVSQWRAECSQSRDRADEKDCAFLSWRHAFERAARQAECRVQILCEAAVPDLILDLGAGRAGVEPDIGDCAPEGTKLLFSRVDRALDRPRVAHVASVFEKAIPAVSFRELAMCP